MQSYDTMERAEGLIYHYLKTPIALNSQQYGVRIVVRENSSGEFFYDAQIADSVEAIMDSLNKNSVEPVTAHKSSVSQRQFFEQTGVDAKPLAYESQASFDNFVADDMQDRGRYVLNLFLNYDENGIEQPESKM